MNDDHIIYYTCTCLVEEAVAVEIYHSYEEQQHEERKWQYVDDCQMRVVEPLQRYERGAMLEEHWHLIERESNAEIEPIGQDSAENRCYQASEREGSKVYVKNPIYRYEEQHFGENQRCDGNQQVY